MTNVNDLYEFVTEWFEPGDLIRVHLTKGKRRACHTYTYEDLLTNTDADLYRVSSDNGEPVNVYFQVHPVKDSELEVWQKGGESNTATMRGVYLDLDIKTGSFQSQAEILEFVHGLEVQPTVLVDSGSGGVHAYYAFEEDVDTTAKPIQAMFREYVKAKAYPRVVDNLRDIAREFRLPGCIRYTSTGATRAVVSVLETTGERVSYQELRELVSPYYEARRGTLQVRRRSEALLLDECDEVLESAPGFLKTVMVEQWINRHVDWSQILTGWTCTGVSSDGTRQWQRPGDDASSRSATTDWPDSPNTMSLFSSSDETGLSQLQEEEVALTKFRVILELHFNNDPQAMMDYYLTQMQD